MIGAFSSAAALDRRMAMDPGLLPYRDRACLRLLYRCDVATTAQLTTLVYRRRQTAQECLFALCHLGYLDRAVLPPSTRGGAPLAFRSAASGCPTLALGDLATDPLVRACPTPVATDAWLKVLGYGGVEETDEALR